MATLDEPGGLSLCLTCPLVAPGCSMFHDDPHSQAGSLGAFIPYTCTECRIGSVNLNFKYVKQEIKNIHHIMEVNLDKMHNVHFSSYLVVNLGCHHG